MFIFTTLKKSLYLAWVCFRNGTKLYFADQAMMKMRERSRCSLLARVTIIVAVFMCWNYFFMRSDQLIFPETRSYWDFNKSHVKSSVFQRHLRSAIDAIHQSNFTPPVNEKCKSRPPVAILIGEVHHSITS